MALGQTLADCSIAWKGWILPRKLLSALTTNAEPFHSLGRISVFPGEPAVILRRLTRPYAPLA
jgi:hypothetical protein